MTFTSDAEALRFAPRPDNPPQEIEAPWIDQLNYHMTLTVQAFQRLHLALDGKFTR